MAGPGVQSGQPRRRVSRAAGPMVLVPRELVPPEYRPPLLPGRRSRRPRRSIWLPAGVVRALMLHEGVPR